MLQFYSKTDYKRNAAALAYGRVSKTSSFSNLGPHLINIKCIHRAQIFSMF